MSFFSQLLCFYVLFVQFLCFDLFFDNLLCFDLFFDQLLVLIFARSCVSKCSLILSYVFIWSSFSYCGFTFSLVSSCALISS